MKSNIHINSSINLDELADSLRNNFNEKQLAKWVIDLAEDMENPYLYLDKVKSNIKSLEKILI